MKRLFIVSLFVLAVVSGLSAQNQCGKKRPSNEERVEMRVNHMTKALGLSDEQKTGLRTILEADTVRPASREDAVKKRTATDEKIKALLTDEQKTKFDEMRSKNERRKKNSDVGV